MTIEGALSLLSGNQTRLSGQPQRALAAEQMEVESATTAWVNLNQCHLPFCVS